MFTNLLRALYLKFLSNHLVQHKMSVINSLVDRDILLSDEKFHKENVNLIETILKNNNYWLKIKHKKAFRT